MPGPRHDPRRRIRRAVPADAAPLAALAAEAFVEAYRDLDDPAEIAEYCATHFTPAHLRAHIEAPASIVLVASLDDVDIGYAHVRASAPPAGVRGDAPVELARLYLRQSAIGQGHGGALMRAVDDAARQLQGRTLWLAVYDRNLRAIHFYRRGGFVDAGTRPFLFGGRTYHDPVMARPVPPAP